MSLDTLQDLMIAELKDLYSAETQLVKALPKMAAGATTASLKKALGDHLEQTKGHVSRLEQIFETLGASPRGKKCKAMEGLCEEGAEMLAEEGADSVRDAGIIASAQRVEHYEMAAYGSTIAFARQMGHDEIVALLQETLDEEKTADSLLSKIAESEINPAADAGDGDEDDEAEEEEAATTASRRSTSQRAAATSLAKATTKASSKRR